MPFQGLFSENTPSACCGDRNFEGFANLLKFCTKSKFDLPFRADLIEREQQNIGELKRAISSHPVLDSKQGNIHFYNDEYEIVIPQLFKSKEDFELGLIYVDPSEDLPDIKTLTLISNMRPRMKILLYLSATNIKRQFQQTQKFLADFLKETSKSVASHICSRCLAISCTDTSDKIR
ncbi:MAG: hypothetical protein MUO77_10230 [Anaerolineales bacterium]|nr:hypothetical protein [Anaerolineales bacterium]